MSVTINVNGLSLCHKGSGGVSMATVPDVCKTPSPGGPVPIPYPNVARSSDLAKGTTSVKADGGNMCANYGSEFSLSTGDEPGTVGGVKSGTFKKEASWITYSFDVKLEGKGACRLTDKMFHNHQNTVNAGGLVQKPLNTTELTKKVQECDAADKVYDAAKKANGGKDPTIIVGDPQTKGGGAGKVNLATGEVRVSDKLDPCQQAQLLTFELGNLSRKGVGDAAYASAKKVSRTDFIRTIERSEYDNAKETNKVFDACKDKWGCGQAKKRYEWVESAKDFDDYFKNYLSNKHKEVYGAAWDALNKAP